MEYQKLDHCESCKAKNVLGMVVCSVFGATSFACCEACLAVDREPYRRMVNYISSAGRWPDDINPLYQREVRRQLKLHGVPEAVFKFEVEAAIAEELSWIELMKGQAEKLPPVPGVPEDVF